MYMPRPPSAGDIDVSRLFFFSCNKNEAHSFYNMSPFVIVITIVIIIINDSLEWTIIFIAS